MGRTESVGDARITTERLTLRPPNSRDAARIAELIDDEAVVRMLSGPPYPYFVDDARAFLDLVEAQGPARNRVFVADHPREGLIGIVGFHTVEHPWPELGYWFGRAFWGRGYATEAARAATAWADTVWGKRALGSGHFHDNPASGRVLAKAGFLYTGERRLRASAARPAPVETLMMVRLS